MAKKRQINLLAVTDFEYTFAGKAISWASNVGRWIVVLTEFVVITAFLSRFYFDTKLANLFDDVRQKKAIVSSMAIFEDQYRQVQNKLALTKILLTETSPTNNTVKLVANQLPLDTTLTNFTTDRNRLTIGGYSLSAHSLQVFIDRLTELKEIDEIEVEKLGARTDGLPGIGFFMSGRVAVKK